MFISKTKKIFFLFLFSSFTFTFAHADAQPPLTILKNARIIDGTGNTPIENGMLVLQGDKIKAVIASNNFSIPANAEVIDETGKTIMPAIIDTHVHLGLTNGTSVSGSNITVANDLRQLHQFAEYGVGAVLSLGKDLDFIYDLRAKRNNKQISGVPYILTAGRGFGTPNGAPPDSDMVYRPTSVQQVKTDMDQLASHHPDIVKLWLDDWHGTMPVMDPNIYKAIIIEAHKHGLKVAAHIHYLADAKNLVNDGADILEHSIRDYPVDQALINAMKAHHVALVPTLTLDDAYFIYADKPSWMQTVFFKQAHDPGVHEMLTGPSYVAKESEREILKLAEKNLKTLYDAGVKIGFGTDAGALPTRIIGFAEHRELELMVAAGLSNMQVIQIATLNSAQILGIDKTMGSLQAGKLANFIVLDKNPLQDIRNTQTINSVWLDGQIVSRGPLHQ